MSFTKMLAATSIALLPTTALADWSGFYIGASFGTVVEGNVAFDSSFDRDIESTNPFGLFLGYQAQNGQLVFGAEYQIAIDSDIELEGVESPDEIIYGEGDLKLRVGYDFGRILGYGLISSSAVAIADENQDIVAGGIGFGIGADYAVNNNFIIGVEYIVRELNGEYEIDGFVEDDDVDVRADSLSLRAAYKF